jgi:hypothetical protein
MRREEGQGLIAQMDCAELWNVTSGKTIDFTGFKSYFNERHFIGK